MEKILRRVYWETTAGCNLRCIHCRRTDVLYKGDPDELTTPQAKALIDELASMGKPVLILSGGEPLARRDIFEIAGYATTKGLPVAVATNGTLINKKTALALKEAGVYYASISLDGAQPATHDFFRGEGNFVRALRGFLALKEAGIKVQLNFTVTKQNVKEIEEMHQLAQIIGAHALYLFLLVPVGCGVQIAGSQMLSAPEVEEWLKWVYRKERESRLPIKAICAPHYYRIEAELSANGTPTDFSRKGCLAGIHMCFISHKGEVFPCGYMPVACGKWAESSLSEIWNHSPVFENLRRPDMLKGRCGACSYKEVCGGCRARAFYATSDILDEEPYCSYLS